MSQKEAKLLPPAKQADSFGYIGVFECPTDAFATIELAESPSKVSETTDARIENLPGFVCVPAGNCVVNDLFKQIESLVVGWLFVAGLLP